MGNKKARMRKFEDIETDSDRRDHNVGTSKTFAIKNKFILNDRHKTFFDMCLYEKTKMVFVDGPAGAAKTYIAVLAALTKLKESKINQIVYIRSIVESATKSIGSLPGEIGDKFRPWSLPLMDKLNELLTPTAISNLFKDEAIRCIPVNFVRGLTFHNSFVIIDEAQNLSYDELRTILTRFGQDSVYVIIGDSKQSDINKSGFYTIMQAFNDQESEDHNIHAFHFGVEDIVRSQILRFIVKKLNC